MVNGTKHLIGFGIWRLEDGFYAVDGWCNNLAHADIRSDMDAISTLRTSKRCMKDARIIRVYETNHRTSQGSMNRMWDLVDETLEMTD